MAIKSETIKQILVVRTDRMGDVLLNVPAIRALKETFGARITLLAHRELKTLFEAIPEVDEVITYDEERWQESFTERWRLLQLVRRRHFGLAVILNPLRRMHILAFAAGIPYRLGYRRKWAFLLTHSIADKKYEGQKHEVEYNLDLVRAIGADTQDLRITLGRLAEEEAYVAQLCKKYALLPADTLVAIAPNTSNPAKCWPKEYFAQLIDKLIAAGVKVAVIGAPAEHSAVLRLLAMTRQQPINLCGKLNLRQLAAFLARARLLIANDSGPVHLAAAVGTPAIVIFGRNIPGVGPRRWGPGRVRPLHQLRGERDGGSPGGGPATGGGARAPHGGGLRRRGEALRGGPARPGAARRARRARRGRNSSSSGS